MEDMVVLLEEMLTEKALGIWLPGYKAEGWDGMGREVIVPKQMALTLFGSLLALQMSMQRDEEYETARLDARKRVDDFLEGAAPKKIRTAEEPAAASTDDSATVF